MGLIGFSSPAEVHYGSCCDLGHAHTHSTPVQSSALPLRHPQSSPGWFFLVSGSGRDTGRELQQAWLNPDPPITNPPLYTKGASQQLCQQVQHWHRHIPGSVMPQHLPCCSLVSPKRGSHSHPAPRSTGDHCHTWIPISALPPGEGQGACTNPVLPQKEPLSDEVLGKKCWNTQGRKTQEAVMEGCEKQKEPVCLVQSRAGLDAVLPCQEAQTHLLLYFLYKFYLWGH